MKKKRERIDLLIARLEDAANGESHPEFEVFEMKEIEKMKREFTDEILAGLGQMYACDERFSERIDRCGEGTAACMSRAIAAHARA